MGDTAEHSSAKPRAPIRHLHRQTIRIADEAEDEWRGGRIIDLIGSPDLFQRAAIENRHAIRHFQRLVLIMGHEDRGVAGALVQVAQPQAQILAHAGVKRAEGLVQPEHARLHSQRTRQSHTLALATRQLPGKARVKAAKLHKLQQFMHALRNLARRRSRGAGAHAQAIADILGHAHMAKECVVLKDETHPPLLHAQAQGVLSGEENLTRRWRLKSGDGAQQGRLARA